MQRIAPALFSLLVVLGIPGPARAQSGDAVEPAETLLDTLELFGRAVDSRSGQPVPGAEAEVRLSDGAPAAGPPPSHVDLRGQTDDSGEFRLDLPRRIGGTDDSGGEGERAASVQVRLSLRQSDYLPYILPGIQVPLPFGNGPARRAAFDPDAEHTYKQEFLGGIEFEVARSVSLGVRYVHRSIGRLLEDYGGLVQPAYDETEQALNRELSDNRGLVTSYRSSKLRGNFEGFFGPPYPWGPQPEPPQERMTPTIPLVPIDPSPEGNPGLLLLGGSGSRLGSEIEFDTSVDRIRDSFNGVPLNGETETADPSDLNRDFGMSFRRAFYGGSAQYTLPFDNGPTAIIQFGRADFELHYDQREGTDTDWNGSGDALILGLAQQLSRGDAFVSARYSFETLSGLDATRSPGLAAEGIEVIRDDGRIDYHAHALELRLGWRTRVVSPWAGVSATWHDLTLEGVAAARFPNPEGTVETQISFVNEFSGTSILGHFGADVRLPGERLFLRAEGATDGSDWRFGASVGCGLFPGF